MAIDPAAVVFLVILGAAAFVFICWATTHFFFQQAPNRDLEMQGDASQAAYMRDVRIRNQESMKAAYGYHSHRVGSTLAYGNWPPALPNAPLSPRSTYLQAPLRHATTLPAPASPSSPLSISLSEGLAAPPNPTMSYGAGLVLRMAERVQASPYINSYAFYSGQDATWDRRVTGLRE